MRLIDADALADALFEKRRNYPQWVADTIGGMPTVDVDALLKEQEAVKPRVSTAEQRCGHCNKAIEMDGWKACPWCGKRIDWKGWWEKNGTCNQDT